MNILDNIAIFFLSFSHVTIIIPLIIIGFLSVNRKIFGQALGLLLLSLLLNNLLKSIFQVPLSPHLGQGYAFPSGHMQSTVVFYGWLIIKFQRNWFRYLSLLILLGIGFGLIEQKYHDIYDVLGGLFFGIIVLIAFNFISSIKLFKRIPPLLGIIMLPIIILISMYLVNISYHVSSYIQLGIWGLAIFSLSWLLLNKNIAEHPCLASAILSVLNFAVIVLLVYIKFPDILNFKSLYKQAILDSLLPLSAFLGQKLATLKVFNYKKLGKKVVVEIIRSKLN